MDKLSGHKWFEYALMDAWGASLACVTVLNADKNMVCFSLRDKNCVEQPTTFIPTSIHTVEIDDQAMNDIIDIVKDKNLYSIDNRRIGVACIDGYMHRFYFSDGVQQTELWGYNLFMCLNHIADYPNVEQVIHVLEKIKSTLTRQGVNEACFSLGQP